jgi:hypothetical protein
MDGASGTSQAAKILKAAVLTYIQAIFALELMKMDFRDGISPVSTTA